MDASLRETVRQRAECCCEYCRLPEEAVPLLTFHVEHVVARQRLDQDEDDLDSLALACDRCNAYKGTNLSSIDPATGEKVDVFNPRLHLWSTHFRFRGASIQARTAIGRATARLLHLNDLDRIELREEWMEHGAL